ncbi:hypothetical protein B2J88_45290 [Rhodococcus sp. SRB_17]|nr:hypothetical protein [Rhodococcus sp. SRB_17]
MRLRTKAIDGGMVIAFDGKSLRGAKDEVGNLTHLLAGLCQRTGVVIGRCVVRAKTNEIPMLTKLLDTMNITNRGVHYILAVKGNQPKLRKQLKDLPPGPQRCHRTRIRQA